jgi:hypothetical protein
MAVLPMLLLLLMMMMIKYTIFMNGGAYPQSTNSFHNLLYERALI